MDSLDSNINTHAESYIANSTYNQALRDELYQRLAQVREGGGEQYQLRQREQGKLFVRDRIDKLLDQGSPFLELAPLAAWDLYDGDAPSAGIVTGIGRVSGVECMIMGTVGNVTFVMGINVAVKRVHTCKPSQKFPGV